MSKYPIFLELEGRRAVVVGGGAVAARKARVLLDAGASIIVVATRVSAKMRNVCNNADADVRESTYAKDCLAGSVLVIAATDDMAVNAQVYEDCRDLGVLCNVVDQPEFCDFYVPAVVKRGNLQIAISTDGACPAYSGRLRKKLQSMFTEQHGEFLEELRVLRTRIIGEVAGPDERKRLLDTLADDRSFELFCDQGPAPWRKYADDLIHNSYCNE